MTQQTYVCLRLYITGQVSRDALICHVLTDGVISLPYIVQYVEASIPI